MSLQMRITILDVFNDLENLRRLCGFSQREIANEIGCTRGSYHNWRTGYTIPSSKYEPEMVRVIAWMQGQLDEEE